MDTLMRRTTTEQFILKAQKIHGSVFDYSCVDYKTAKTKVTINCHKHGPFSMTPDNHLSGQGCPCCGRMSAKQKGFGVLLSKETIVKRATSRHGSLYDYSRVSYTHQKQKIEIMCKTHGSFFQTPDAHINSGAGCPHCYREQQLGGYSYDLFEQQPQIKTKQAWLYLIKLFPKDGSDPFFKIGITVNVKNRLNGFVSYKKEIVATYKTTLYTAFVVEQQILKMFNNAKKYPEKWFKGGTECLRLTELQQKEIRQSIDYFLQKNLTATSASNP